jgi:hypothetical protein
LVFPSAGAVVTVDVSTFCWNKAASVPDRSTFEVFAEFLSENSTAFPEILTLQPFDGASRGYCWYDGGDW